jgi:hypothetical protein
VQLTNERVGVFLARRSMQHLVCLEYSLNMAEAADFSMPDAFAKDYLDRIIKKTETKFK